MFGSSMLGDGFEDMLGGQLRQLNSMMNSMNSLIGGSGISPFGDMLGGHGQRTLMPFAGPANNMMSPFMVPGFGGGLQQSMLIGGGGGHSFSSSSTYMSMASGPDGKPQVYQASSSTVAGPDGVRETKKSVSDTRTGTKKMSIGHFIGDRGHIKEKEQNMYSGDREENEEYLNIEEEEADEFNNEWATRAGHNRQMSHQPAIGYREAPRSNYYRNDAIEYPALQAPPHPSAYGADSSLSNQQKKKQRSKPYFKKSKKSQKESK